MFFLVSEATRVLREARQLVKSGQHAAALEKYIWFHDHALDFDRMLVGVRLSYAIDEWVVLGEVYPPAREALERVRDAKTVSLAQGTCDVAITRPSASRMHSSEMRFRERLYSSLPAPRIQ